MHPPRSIDGPPSECRTSGPDGEGSRAQPKGGAARPHGRNARSPRQGSAIRQRVCRPTAYRQRMRRTAPTTARRLGRKGNRQEARPNRARRDRTGGRPEPAQSGDDAPGWMHARPVKAPWTAAWMEPAATRWICACRCRDAPGCAGYAGQIDAELSGLDRRPNRGFDVGLRLRLTRPTVLRFRHH